MRSQAGVISSVERVQTLESGTPGCGSVLWLWPRACLVRSTYPVWASAFSSVKCSNTYWCHIGLLWWHNNIIHKAINIKQKVHMRSTYYCYLLRQIGDLGSSFDSTILDNFDESHKVKGEKSLNNAFYFQNSMFFWTEMYWAKISVDASPLEY